MSLVLQDFRGQILRCSAKSKSSVLDGFGEPEVRKFEVAVSPNQYVFGLEVSIDNVLAMKIFEYK